MPGLKCARLFPGLDGTIHAMFSMEKNDEWSLTVIGGGLAGCEAALQAAGRGLKVRLYEMRPERDDPGAYRR